MNERHEKDPSVFIAAVVALAMSWPGIGFAQEKSEQRLPVSFVHEGGQFLPAAPEKVTLFPDHPELEGRFSEESIIRMAYATLAQAIASSGHGVAFELSDFHTYYRREFEDVLLLDILTLDSPVRLEITVTQVGPAEGETVGRAFIPKWVPAFTMEDLAELDEWLSQFDGYTLARLLEEPDADETHKNLIAVTSFAVHVTFNSEPRDYRAIFKWAQEDRGTVTFLIEDHVTDAIDQALVAGQQVAPISILLEQSRQRARAHADGSGEEGEQ
ncbi:MAG: hypothetical protein OEM62_01615 [Acidobacteriota bacterium]|nr:hypothetical protein [Acidobacteriota bacterium]